jgi:ribosome-binding protein aMBF1 (putative translation factor)
MAIHKWKDIQARKTRTPEQVERLTRRVRDALVEMDLRAIREAAGVTQEELAAKVEISQSQLSRLERGDLSRLPTLRKVVEALGGELEVTAVIKGKRVRLAGT